MSDDDPMRLFFPDDGDVDLYAVLGLDQSEKPGTETIRKAYRKMALAFHPDKAALHGRDADHVALKFQQIGFAYSVLSDEKRRKRYDATGSTSDSVWDSDEPVDWNEYFKTLWTGEVNARTLDEFKASYQHSDEERMDVLQAYRDYEGSIAGIFSAVPCSNILDDERRFIDIVNQGIKDKAVKMTPAWKDIATPKGKKMRKELREKARSEATEAEAYAKELGVWDDLFGKQRQQQQPKEKPQETEQDDESVDLDGLRAAMRAKASKRESAFDDMIARLERKHTKTPRAKKQRRAP